MCGCSIALLIFSMYIDDHACPSLSSLSLAADTPLRYLIDPLLSVVDPLLPQQVDLFYEMSDDERWTIAKHLYLKWMEPGEYVVKAGARQTHLHVVRSGLCAATVQSYASKDEIAVVKEYKPGSTKTLNPLSPTLTPYLLHELPLAPINASSPTLGSSWGAPCLVADDAIHHKEDVMVLQPNSLMISLSVIAFASLPSPVQALSNH